MPPLSPDELARALPFAASVALVAGLGTRRVLAGLFAGTLALIAVGRPDAAPLGAPGSARLLEPVVPELLSRAPDGTTDLVAAAWLGPPAAGALLDVGLAGLLAAALGVAAAPGPLAWVARATLLAGAGGLCLAAPLGLEIHGLLTQLSLCVLAGMGLATVCRLDSRDGALLVVGGLAVLVAGALALAATSAGASDPRQLMEPIVEGLRQQGLEPPPRVARDAAAARLVTRLDRAALAAFAAMTALLLLLKARRPWAVVLLAAVALGEFFWR